MAENKSFLEFIEKLNTSPTSFRITKTQSKSLKRFLKKELVNNKTGEILNSSDLKPLIDFDKINKYKEQFGYYQIVTSELNMPDKEVINTYHGLSRIEDQFRVMKGDLETRPMFVRTKAHIDSHLLVCMIALIVVRIIQNKIVKYKNNVKTKNWETGLSGRRIQDALNKWTVSEISNGLYRFNDTDNEDLKLILDSFNIQVEYKLYKKMELLNLKTSINISD
jgi:transposase